MERMTLKQLVMSDMPASEYAKVGEIYQDGYAAHLFRFKNVTEQFCFVVTEYNPFRELEPEGTDDVVHVGMNPSYTLSTTVSNAQEAMTECDRRAKALRERRESDHQRVREAIACGGSDDHSDYDDAERRSDEQAEADARAQVQDTVNF